MSQIRTRCISAFVAVFVACAPGGDASNEAPANDVAPAAVTQVADVGLETPESVLYDDQADIYLVSNINGAPAAKDDNGFISRIRPDGSVEALKWVDGTVAGVTLHAPKGMALIGDTLFVTDIDTVRAFHRTTGAPISARGVPGATFLNDLAVGADGMLYVTDTGVDASFQPTGTDAIHRFGAAGAEAVTTRGQLSGPNGIIADGDGIIVVGFTGATVQRVTPGGAAPTVVATLPGGQLDGVVRMDDGTLFVSSWETGTIYRIATDGSVTAIAQGIEAPADIGFDTRRHRIMVPQFNANAIRFVEMH